MVNLLTKSFIKYHIDKQEQTSDPVKLINIKNANKEEDSFCS